MLKKKKKCCKKRSSKRQCYSCAARNISPQHQQKYKQKNFFFFEGNANVHTHTHGPTVTHFVFVFFWTYLRLGFFGTVITTPPNSDDNDVDVHDDEDELGGERHRFRGGRYSLRYAMVVRLRRNFLLSGPLRRYHVGPHSGSHVIGPRRPRNPPT